MAADFSSVVAAHVSERCLVEFLQIAREHPSLDYKTLLGISPADSRPAVFRFENLYRLTSGYLHWKRGTVLPRSFSERQILFLAVHEPKLAE